MQKDWFKEEEMERKKNHFAHWPLQVKLNIAYYYIEKSLNNLLNGQSNIDFGRLSKSEERKFQYQCYNVITCGTFSMGDLKCTQKKMGNNTPRERDQVNE